MNALQTIYHRLVTHPLTASPGGEPLLVAPQDLGDGIDEDELARQMSAPLPENQGDQALPEMDPETFEADFHWFFS